MLVYKQLQSFYIDPKCGSTMGHHQTTMSHPVHLSLMSDMVMKYKAALSAIHPQSSLLAIEMKMRVFSLSSSIQLHKAVTNIDQNAGVLFCFISFQNHSLSRFFLIKRARMKDL